MGDRRSAVEALLAYFDVHQRDMPWRDTSEPYAIWISEVMLQQTRVDVVRPYYERWLQRYPTVQALAAADLDDVLREWQGLGYYSRARNLHRAARLIRERHGGSLPGNVGSLRALPGVGEYTAGAIASIAFGIAAPAVDGNVRRVLCRLHDLEDPTAAELRSIAGGMVPADRPGDFNQALMELGATICTPRSPACPACPLAEWCRARARRTQGQRPRSKPRKPVPEESVNSVVFLRDGGEVLLVRRPDRGLLAGLWEFPADDGALIAELRNAARPIASLPTIVHVYSHRKVTYRPTLCVLEGVGAARAMDGLALAVGDRGHAWVPLRDPGRYAMPVAQQEIAAAAVRRLAGR